MKIAMNMNVKSLIRNFYWNGDLKKNFADADGGPRSRVRTAGHSAQPPIDISGNFSVHVSAE